MKISEYVTSDGGCNPEMHDFHVAAQLHISTQTDNTLPDKVIPALAYC